MADGAARRLYLMKVMRISTQELRVRERLDIPGLD